jgi:hypothetical protein
MHAFAHQTADSPPAYRVVTRKMGQLKTDFACTLQAATSERASRPLPLA